MGRLLWMVAISFPVWAGTAFAQTAGRDLYIAKCAACHAPDGSGNCTIGRSLKLNDMRPSIPGMTDEQVRQILLEGKGKMPGLKKFDEEKVRKLTLFLRDLAAGNPDTGVAASEAQRQPLAQVDTVYRDKCSACHARDGAGRTSIGKSLKIPDLTSATVQSQSDDELAEVISSGKGRMRGYAKAFNSAQVSQLVSHIRGLSKGGRATERVEHGQASPSIPGQAPPVPAGVKAPPEPTSPARSSALSPVTGTAAKRSPEVERRKAGEPKPNKAQATATKSRSVRQMYVARCSACHSSDGSGRGTIGKSMRIPSLTSPEVQGQSDEILAEAISNGVGKMPAYKKKYSREEIRLLVAYIRELGKRQ